MHCYHHHLSHKILLTITTFKNVSSVSRCLSSVPALAPYGLGSVSTALLMCIYCVPNVPLLYPCHDSVVYLLQLPCVSALAATDCKLIDTLQWMDKMNAAVGQWTRVTHRAFCSGSTSYVVYHSINIWCPWLANTAGLKIQHSITFVHRNVQNIILNHGVAYKKQRM